MSFLDEPAENQVTISLDSTLHQLDHLLRRVLKIGINSHYKVARAVLQGAEHCGMLTIIPDQADGSDFGIEACFLFHNLPAPVSASIVNYDNFVRTVPGFKSRCRTLKRFSDRLILVVRGHDHAVLEVTNTCYVRPNSLRFS